MSGYSLQILSIMLVNVVAAYAAYMPLAGGQLNLGVAGFMVIGAYTSALLGNAGLPLPLAMLSGVGLTLLAGLALSYPVLRARGIYLTIATLAFAEMIVAVILNSDYLGGATGIVVKQHISIVTMALVAVAVVGTVVFLSSTRFGLALTAIRNDARGAAVFGLEVRRTEVIAFTIGAGFAGLAGAMHAHHFSYLEAQHFNVVMSTYAVLFTLLGGLQTPLGPLVGAALFTIAPEMLRDASEWRYVIFGAAIVILMLVRADGLLTRALTHRATLFLKKRAFG